jgi:hypothetical protein
VTEKMKAKDYLGGLFPVSGRPKALEPKEAGISKAIEDYLNRLHVYTDRMNAGSVEVIKRFKLDASRQKGNTRQILHHERSDIFYRGQDAWQATNTRAA